MQAIPLKRRVSQNPRRAKKKKRSAAARPRKHKAPKAKATKTRKRKTSNPLALVGALNGKGAAKMAGKTSKKKKKKTAGNPHRATGKRSGKKKGGRKNPNRSGAASYGLTKPVGMIKAGGAILGGLLGTRQLPQVVLAERNAGPLGYAANVGSALLLAIVTALATNRFYGFLVGAGGFAYTISRVATEKFSPIGKVLSLTGVGDASAAGFGVLKQGSFPVPAVVDKNGRLLIPQDYLDQVREMMAAEYPQPAARQIAAAPAMSGMGRSQDRFANRFVS